MLDLDPRTLGRFGGVVVAMVGAAALVGAGYMFANGWRAWTWLGTASFGVMMLLAAIAAFRHAAPRLGPEMSKEELRARIGDRPVPFTVCTSCFAIVDGRAIGCARCAAVATCVSVETDADRGLARSALG